MNATEHLQSRHALYPEIERLRAVIRNLIEVAEDHPSGYIDNGNEYRMRAEKRMRDALAGAREALGR